MGIVHVIADEGDELFSEETRFEGEVNVKCQALSHFASEMFAALIETDPTWIKKVGAWPEGAV